MKVYKLSFINLYAKHRPYYCTVQYIVTSLKSVIYFSQRLGCNVHEDVHFVCCKSSYPVFHEHIGIISKLNRS